MLKEHLELDTELPGVQILQILCCVRLHDMRKICDVR